MKLVPHPWVTPIADWSLHLTAAGRSSGTIATRTDHLRRVSRALGGCPWGVTPDDLTGWAGRQTWARDTRRSTYASLRGFWSWGVTTGRTSSNPAIALPTVSPSPPKPRPAGERALATALQRSDSRTQLILWLAADAGLRRSEIAQVHRRDLVDDLTGWSLVVHGKGNKDRVVPLTDPLAAAVMAACLAGGGYAFPGDTGGHLSPRWVGTLASRALPDEVTLHMLRHRYATRTYSASGDLLSVQALLGHVNPATTQRYVALDPGRLRAAIAWAA